MSLSQQFLDKEDKKGNIYLNTNYSQLRVDIFKIINQLTYTEKKAELLTEDVLEIVDKFLIESKKPNKAKFDIGAYKRECINKLEHLKVGSSLSIEDRIFQTVEWWIRQMENTMIEFKNKKFLVQSIDHNTQNIRRIK